MVVAGSAAEKVAEFIVLSAESICRVMLLEPAERVNDFETGGFGI